MTVSFAVSAGGSVRHYSAELANSKWQLSSNSPIACSLSHSIPNYGNAIFSTKASRESNMFFELDMIRLPDSYGLAEVRSVAPKWRPGVADKVLANEKVYKQFNIGADKELAWQMLNELEKGMSPTLYYTDWYSKDDTVSVGLSTAQFRKGFTEFVDCMSKMLDYSFEDIAYTVLNYKKNSDELTKASKKRLAKIQNYLQHDKDIELVLVEGFSDSYGGRWHNQQVSEKRANKIKQYFTATGLPEDRIESIGHGEKRHIASNASILGREKNRRVVIHMEKP